MSSIPDDVLTDEFIRGAVKNVDIAGTLTPFFTLVYISYTVGPWWLWLAYMAGGTAVNYTFKRWLLPSLARFLIRRRLRGQEASTAA